MSLPSLTRNCSTSLVAITEDVLHTDSDTLASKVIDITETVIYTGNDILAIKAIDFQNVSEGYR